MDMMSFLFVVKSSLLLNYQIINSFKAVVGTTGIQL